MDAAIDQLTPLVGVKAACRAVGRPRSSHYRRRSGRPSTPHASRKGQAQPRSLSVAEREQVLDVLHDERFVDQAPASVYASLLDEGLRTLKYRPDFPGRFDSIEHARAHCHKFFGWLASPAPS